MAWDSEFEELMADTVVAQPGYLDGFGEWTASGSALSISCHIEGRARLVRDFSGREVVSSVQIYSAGAYGLTVDGYVYTLPTDYSPRENLRAISVEKVRDEDGAHHEVVNLP